MVTSYQYPQYLYALKHEGDATQQPNGSWQTNPKAWELKAICREETNGKGTSIQTADGRTLVFASLIQLPKGTSRINEGTEILVTKQEVNVTDLLTPGFIESAVISGIIVVKGICQKFDLGRLHCRIWI